MPFRLRIRICPRPFWIIWIVGWVERTRETHRMPLEGPVDLASMLDPPYGASHADFNSNTSSDRNCVAPPRLKTSSE
jgi:hypothetical protein